MKQVPYLIHKEAGEEDVAIEEATEVVDKIVQIMKRMVKEAIGKKTIQGKEMSVAKMVDKIIARQLIKEEEEVGNVDKVGVEEGVDSQILKIMMLVMLGITGNEISI